MISCSLVGLSFVEVRSTFCCVLSQQKNSFLVHLFRQGTHINAREFSFLLTFSFTKVTWNTWNKGSDCTKKTKYLFNMFCSLIIVLPASTFQSQMFTIALDMCLIFGNEGDITVLVFPHLRLSILVLLWRGIEPTPSLQRKLLYVGQEKRRWLVPRKGLWTIWVIDFYNDSLID